jgi:hypothetical protein
MKLNPFRWRAASASAPAPETAKQPFEAPAPRRSAPEPPSRMYSLMLPSFTDRN